MSRKPPFLGQTTGRGRRRTPQPVEKVGAMVRGGARRGAEAPICPMWAAARYDARTPEEGRAAGGRVVPSRVAGLSRPRRGRLPDRTRIGPARETAPPRRPSGERGTAGRSSRRPPPGTARSWPRRRPAARTRWRPPGRRRGSAPAPGPRLRHKHGDWGDLSEEDRLENERALREGSRLLSTYSTRRADRLWVITEWDRSVTTMLLPEEY